MSVNGRLRRVLPPGHVDARCVVAYQIGTHGKIETRSGPGVLVTPGARHRGEISMRPKATTPSVQRVCAVCNATFYTYPSRVRDGVALTCSRACLGQMMATRARARTVERFWANVDKWGPIPSHRPELGPCWVWIGRRSRSGYGRFFMGSLADGSRGDVQAHRFSSELADGPIPDGLFVLHGCDNPPCVRPEHLSRGTPAENTADMVAKGRDQFDRGKGLLRVSLTCEQCGQAFEVPPSNATTRQGQPRRFCRRACADAYRTGRPRVRHGANTVAENNR